MKRFYDTNALINLSEKAFAEHFYIAGVTLREIENIKTNAHKDLETKIKARQLARKLIENQACYEVNDVVIDDKLQKELGQLGLSITPDNLICYIAALAIARDSDIVFVTGDISCYMIAKQIFKLPVEYYESQAKDLYRGYREVIIEDDAELSMYYDAPNDMSVDMTTNEYIVLRRPDGEFIDCLRWSGDSFIRLSSKPFKSTALGTIKPLDEYQRMAFDSLINDEITLLTGKAGSGKTTLPLAYAMQQIENQKYRKLVMIYSFETLKNAKQLGYIKGDIQTKLMETASIGNILTWKFGDDSIVKRMMASGTLEIIPTANLRGVEFTDSIVYITEGQNLDTYTLKTAIQRCKSDTKFIIEGDVLEQSDINRSSGMLRMIDVFKGYKGFGAVKLKNVYRSQISELADNM